MTGLSVGLIIMDVLSDAVGNMVNKIFPLLTEKAELPYIAYGHSGNEPKATKTGRPTSDTCIVEVECFGNTYAEAVKIAEAVREALDYKAYQIEGLVMRQCIMSNAKDDYRDGAFIKSLTFECKV